MRYEMADERIEIVDRLWTSWEPGAVRADRAAGIFADSARVHPIDYVGQHYRSRGPLNLRPGPQGRPVICQAGGSPAGRRFAARHADTIIALVRDVAEAKAYRADITARLAESGRPADACKVMFCMSVVLGETIEEARERKRRRHAALAADLAPRLAALSFFSAIDLSRVPLDEPMAIAETNASRTMTQVYTAQAKTLREVATDPDVNGIPFVGTPDSVAAEMVNAMAEIGGDGFLFTEALSRRAITEGTDGLIPALQKRGQSRRGYDHKTLRDNLFAF